jgi:hypothetical protein
MVFRTKAIYPLALTTSQPCCGSTKENGAFLFTFSMSDQVCCSHELNCISHIRAAGRCLYQTTSSDLRGLDLVHFADRCPDGSTAFLTGIKVTDKLFGRGIYIKAPDKHADELG